MDQILQWNSRSVNLKKNDIIYLINKHKPTCFAITETWLKPSSVFLIPGFACLRHDRQDGWDGVALLISNKTKYSQISLPSLPGVYAVAAKLSSFSILNVYIPHPTSQITYSIKLLINCLSPPFLVVGDFNSHHTLWGSLVCDGPGVAIASIMDEENLFLLNDGRPTRRTSPTQAPSAVDLSFCSGSLASLLSWNLDKLSYGSDHFPILMSFPSVAPRTVASPLQRYRLERADWDSFSLAVNEKVSSLPSVNKNNVSHCYESFVSSLHSAAREFIPLKKCSSKLPPCPWWDSDCSRLVKERNLAETLFVECMSLENFINYRKADAKCKRLLSKRKSVGWRSFCESMAPNTHPSVVWRNVRRFRSSKNALPSPASNVTSWSQEFLDKLAPPFVPFYTELPINYCVLNSNNALAAPFSLAELKNVLCVLSDSAPGIDGISYSFIVKAKESTHQYFLALINCMFSHGFVPAAWKDQIILPILKPGKDPKLSSSYRPIALSSVLGKVTEHLIKNRLDWFAESRKIFPHAQFGFRKGKSVTDSHSILYTDIRIAFSKNAAVVAAFLDVASAYDNVLISVLRSKLIKLSVPWVVVQFICNFLSTRKISLRLDGENIASRCVLKGLPQGSVLSPILFNLYTHDLYRVVNKNCNILQYADDICIYSSNACVAQAVSSVNSSLEALSGWLAQHGLDVSPSKSCAIVFCRKRSMPNVSVKYRNEIIPLVDRTKFLGMILDFNLSGKYHIEHIVNKCDKNINIMRSLSGVWWGGHPYTQKLLYNALVRSLLDFGSFLLSPCSKASLVLMDNIQVKALRVVLGAMKSSPKQAILVESSDPPLHLRRQYLADRYLFRVSQISSHPIISKLQTLRGLLRLPYWRNKEKPTLIKSLSRLNGFSASLYQLEFLPLYSLSFEALCFSAPVLLNVGLDKKCTSANTIFLKIVAERWSGWDLFFCDASKSHGVPVGAAFLHLNSGYSAQHKLPVEASVFSGECVAILCSLLLIIEQNINKSVIFSDCLSALQAISTNPFRSCARNGLICKIKDLLFSCFSSGLQVILVWIPGHAGIEGNEMADALAKDACNTGNLHFFQNYSQDLLCVPSSNLFRDWNKEWESFKYKFSKIQPSVVPRPWFFKFRLFSKATTSVLIRLRLGHFTSPVQLYKFKILASPVCSCGLEEGSLDHIFFNCPINSKTPPLYSSLTNCDIPFPVCMNYLISFPNKDVIYTLAVFISGNNIRL